MHLRSPLLVAFLLLAGTGCSVLLPNNRQALQAGTAVVAGDTAAALRALEGQNDLPACLDRAVILADAGRYAESNREFDRALEKIRDYEGRARVSGRAVARNAGSVLVNDKVLEYQGEGYEKVLLHTLKAQNYLLVGNFEAARVEIRNANMRQDEERKRHQEAIDEAQQEAKRAKLDLAGVLPEIDRQFAPQSSILRRLDNVYQNPFATYLSGVVYEANDEPGDAFVDYKKAYTMVPSPLVSGELSRLAQQLGRRDEAASLGLAVPRGQAPPAGDTLVVIGNGFAPQRAELKFPLPGPNTVLFVAVPITRPVPTDLSEVEVLDVDGTSIGRTQVLVDVEAMSVRDLRDRYPEILVRQFIRLAAKAAAGYEAQRQLGTTGLILSSVFNAVTEQADLRTWYALPRTIHVARVTTPPGAQSVRLRLLDQSGQAIREVTAPIASANPKLKLVAARWVAGRLLTGPQTVAQQARATR